MTASQRLARLARLNLHLAFPERVEIPTDLLDEVRTRLPALDLTRIRVRRGFPSLIWLGRQSAITLPGTFSVSAIDICFRPQSWRRNSHTTANILLHEAFHALQYQQVWNGFGLGYFRPFIISYLAHAFTKGGGISNPLERPAYAFATRTDIICDDSGFRFWRELWQATPFGSQLPIPFRVVCFMLFTLSAAATALAIAIVKPVIDIALLVVAAVLFSAARLLAFAGK